MFSQKDIGRLLAKTPIKKTKVFVEERLELPEQEFRFGALKMRAALVCPLLKFLSAIPQSLKENCWRLGNMRQSMPRRSGSKYGKIRNGRQWPIPCPASWRTSIFPT